MRGLGFFTPAFLRLRGNLEEPFEISTSESGVWKLPKGEAYNKYLLKNQAQTNKTPQEILEQVVEDHTASTLGSRSRM